MATQSPFSWAAQALPDMLNQMAANFQPPAWVVDESVNRLVLFLNHVLMSEPEAMARLARQKGQRIELVWDRMQLQLTPTPAGLLERGRFDGFDLRLSVTEASPVSHASALPKV
jgi:ubiquinone biosynthesis protein UbiJ